MVASLCSESTQPVQQQLRDWPTSDVRDEAHNEQNQEDEEQDLGDAGSSESYHPKTQNAGY